LAKTESIARLFGTDGVRGVAGRYPLDRATIQRLARRSSGLCRTAPRRYRGC
jgi:phosphomannomutase